MAISEAFAINAVSVSTTELSIVSGTTTLQNNTTAGGYMLFLDGIAAAMAKGDEFIIRIYEKTTASATKRARMGHDHPEVRGNRPFVHGLDPEGRVI
jgi:hypothetical protein